MLSSSSFCRAGVASIVTPQPEVNLRRCRTVTSPGSSGMWRSIRSSRGEDAVVDEQERQRAADRLGHGRDPEQAVGAHRQAAEGHGARRADAGLALHADRAHVPGAVAPRGCARSRPRRF
jgi:hypothetical protein